FASGAEPRLIHYLGYNCPIRQLGGTRKKYSSPAPSASGALNAHNHMIDAKGFQKSSGGIGGFGASVSALLWRGLPSVALPGDDDLGPDRNPVVKVDHVVIVHADAAMGDVLAHRPRRIGAVNAVGRIAEIHGAGT